MKEPHKVLIISCVFPPEPVVSANLSYDLAKHLSKVAQVTVISPKPTRPLGYNFTKTKNLDHSTYFEHIVTTSFTSPLSSFIGRFRESISFGYQCRQHILRINEAYDCIYMNNWPVFAQYFVAKAAFRRGIRLVTHIQDIYPESLTQKLPIPLSNILFALLYPLDFYVLKHSSRIITISNGMKHYMLDTRRISDNKISVIYNWQNLKRFQKSYNSVISNNDFTFLFLGTIGPLANLEYVISTFSKIESPDIKLIIAGQGADKNRLMKFVGFLKDPRITFTDAPAEKVAEMQSQADVLLLSLKSGAAKFALPSKLVAYMYSGKAILGVVDEDSDISNILKDSNSGWAVSPKNSDGLLSLFKSIPTLSNKDLLMKGKNGFQYAQEKFTAKKNLDNLTKLIIED